MGLQYDRLCPEPAQVGIEALFDPVDFAALASDDRPYLLANFVASVDGRATIGGRSGPLGDEGDRAMFHGLRGQVEAVMAGTGTLQTERYGRIIRDANARAARVKRGLTPEPVACVVTRTGRVPTEIPLFAEPEARVIVFSPGELDLHKTQAQVEVVHLDPSDLSLTTMMRRLCSDFGVRSLLCEGGPTLLGALIQERLVDELFLTLAPKLAGGGTAPTITLGPELPEPGCLRLEWALEREGSLYLRYAFA